MKNVLIACSLASVAALAACGGGGSSPSMPTVNAAAASVPTPTSASPAATPTPALTQTQSALGTSSFTTSGRGTQSGFATATGFAVYSFDLDLGKTTSQCNGACAANWPPVAPPAGVTLAAPWSAVARQDGTMQLAYDGHPLYTFTEDTQSGIANGDGLNAFGAVWHLAQAASLTANATPDPSAAPTASPY